VRGGVGDGEGRRGVEVEAVGEERLKAERVDAIGEIRSR